MTMATLMKKTVNWWLAYSFRGSVHYHHGGEHGGAQVDVVLELRVLHLDWKAAGSQLTAHWGKLEQERPQSPPHSDTHPSIRPQCLTVSFPLGSIFFQTTTPSNTLSI